jgi:hypothetical protein
MTGVRNLRETQDTFKDELKTKCKIILFRGIVMAILGALI